ncbi:MAG: cysteine--tRNA ligase [Candidatus Nanoarchaeia archaeon]
MVLKVFNTLTRELEEFKPLKEGEVTLYTCGPTVYNHVHIGNLRCFTFYDILRRYLEYKGLKVHHVMNITDVDDKTIRDSQANNIPFKEFTEHYTKVFIEDLETLNIKIAHDLPKATDYIDEMAKFVQTLVDNGAAYKSDDGSIYFSVKEFTDYGKLSRIDLSQLQAGASGRITTDEYEKDQASDFAVWKAWDEQDGDVFWETPLGKGRPGWHIECSVMSTSLLGKTFDIHTGGVDLIFPHHENEIAQSEACTDQKFVNYWMHNAHILVDGKKMSKSLGNFYTLPQLLEKGFDPMAIRYALMSVHYRFQMNFTFEVVEAAANSLEKLRIFVLSLNDKNAESNNPDLDNAVTKCKNHFEAAMDEDLETSKALAAVYDFIREINKMDLSKNDAHKVRDFLKKINDVLGVIDFTEESIPQEIKDLAEQREQARKDKDWNKSDELRDLINEKGYVVDDSPDGYKLRKK